MLSLDTEGRGLFLHQFHMPALMTPHGRNYTLQGVDGVWRELGERGRRVKFGWYKNEIKKLKKIMTKIWMWV